MAATFTPGRSLALQQCWCARSWVSIARTGALALVVASAAGCRGDCDEWVRESIDERIVRVAGNVGISRSGEIFVSEGQLDFQPRASAGAPLHGVAANNPSLVAVVGQAGTIRVSTDGGRTWTKPSSPEVEEDLLAVSVACDTPDLGIAVGSAGRILRGTSRGGSWSIVAAPTQRDLQHVAMSDGVAHVIVAVGDAGTIVRSEDDGLTWAIVESGTGEDLTAVDFRSSCDPHPGIARSVGFAAGAGGTALFSDDDGESWQPLELGLEDRLRSVRLSLPELPITERLQGELLGEGGRVWIWQEGDPGAALLHDFGEPILWYDGMAGGVGSLYWYRSGKACAED